MEYDYGLWLMVAINVAVFIVFSLGFLKPKTKYDWHSFGVLSAFVLALFTEMYGFPLTIYLVSALLGRFPTEQPFSHMSGNIWASLFLSPEWGAGFMLLGGVLMAAGAWVISVSWKRIHAAQGGLVTQGPYAVIRHPQYAGLVVAVIGALVQWPTLITMLMAPILVAMYWRLAKREDRNLEKQFGDGYRAYREQVPPFLPSPSSFSRHGQESYVGEAHE